MRRLKEGHYDPFGILNKVIFSCGYQTLSLLGIKSSAHENVGMAYYFNFLIKGTRGIVINKKRLELVQTYPFHTDWLYLKFWV